MYQDVCVEDVIGSKNTIVQTLERTCILFYHFQIHTLKPVPLRQHKTEIVINETCRFIRLDVEDLYVNTPISAMIHINELLLNINSTEAPCNK